MMASAARWVKASYRGWGQNLPLTPVCHNQVLDRPGACGRRLMEQGQRMPRIKLSPTIVVAVASLIAFGSQIQAAQESQPKKPVAKQVAKLLPAPAKKTASKTAVTRSVAAKGDHKQHPVHTSTIQA